MFYGSTLTDEACETLLLQKFGGGERAFRKHLEKEWRLMRSKWFDYRILHPVVATYLYAHEYTKAYRRYYASIIDYERSQYVKGFSGSDPWFSNASTAFVKGRQKADELGIRYDFYLSAAYDYLYRKKWKHIARPCHLYAEDVAEEVSAKWREYTGSILVSADDYFFKDAANVESPEYRAHQVWLNKQISRSKVKALTIELLHDRGFSLTC